MSNTQTLWIGMNSDLTIMNSNVKWTIGEWETGDFCVLKKILDAIKYAPFMKILAMVEVGGKCISKGRLSGFPEYWSKMRIVKAWKWGKKEKDGLCMYRDKVRRINIDEACEGLIEPEKEKAMCMAIGKSGKQEEIWIRERLGKLVNIKQREIKCQKH